MWPVATNRDLYVFPPPFQKIGAGQSHTCSEKTLLARDGTFWTFNLTRTFPVFYQLGSDCTRADLYRNARHTGTKWEIKLWGWLPPLKEKTLWCVISFLLWGLTWSVQSWSEARFCSPSGRKSNLTNHRVVFQERSQFCTQGERSYRPSLCVADRRLAGSTLCKNEISEKIHSSCIKTH